MLLWSGVTVICGCTRQLFGVCILCTFHAGASKPVLGRLAHVVKEQHLLCVHVGGAGAERVEVGLLTRALKSGAESGADPRSLDCKIFVLISRTPFLFLEQGKQKPGLPEPFLMLLLAGLQAPILSFIDLSPFSQPRCSCPGTA